MQRYHFFLNLQRHSRVDINEGREERSNQLDGLRIVGRIAVITELKKYFRPLAKFIRISPSKPLIYNHLIISIIAKCDLPGEAKLVSPGRLGIYNTLVISKL